MAKQSEAATDEELLDDLRSMLTLYTFAVVKELVSRHQQTSGWMPCPRCNVGQIRYSVAPSNGHMRAKCSTPNCVDAME